MTGVHAILRARWTTYLEQRLALGLGGPRCLISCLFLPMLGARTISAGFGGRRQASPDVGFHGLRHSHASALLTAGVDELTISRRPGHATPAFTLAIYGNLFDNTDAAAAKALDGIFSKVTRIGCQSSTNSRFVLLSRFCKKLIRTGKPG